MSNLVKNAHDPRLDDSEFEYAGFWVRLAAYFIDGIVFMIVLLPYFYYSYVQLAELPVDQVPAYSLIDFLVSILGVIVVVWFWVKKGATPGKMLFGLQIRDLKTGQFISMPKALLRYLIGYTISSILLCLGFIWIAFDKKKQGWHDKIAGTVVVKRIR